MRLIYKMPKDGVEPFIEHGKLMFYSSAISYDFGFITNLPPGKWIIESWDKKTVTIKKGETEND